MKPRAEKAKRAARSVLEQLRAAGFTALFAGGCVRDTLLARAPKDFDVATDARPERLLKIFPHARRVGAQFGVILVRKYGCHVEVATFRSDGPYSDGRHPDSIRFGTAEEDARRRDFTINGMFLDPDPSGTQADFPTDPDGVIDFVGGRADLQARMIRTIGEPQERFAEDHLRLLRAVRFAARLGFDIARDTFAAMRELAPRLADISPERIWMELELILADPSRARGWKLLRDAGLHEWICPAWSSEDDDEVGPMPRLAALPQQSWNVSLPLAVATIPRPRAVVNRICRELRVSNELRESVHWLQEAFRRMRRQEPLELADVKGLMASPNWPNFLELSRAESRVGGLPVAAVEELEQRAAAIKPSTVAPAPLLDGEGLHAMNVPAGPVYGRVLHAVYRAQLNEEIRTQAEARALAERLLAGEA